MSPLTVTHAVALVAVGVHATTALVLLALAPRNRPVRWYIGFLATMVPWLALVALDARARGPGLRTAASLVSHLIPLSFVLFALVVRLDARPRTLARTAAAALALVPFVAVVSPWYVFAADLGYQTACWLVGALLLSRLRVVGGRVTTGPRAPRGIGVVPASAEGPPPRLLAALAALPLAVAVIVLASARADVSVLAPAISTMAQGVVLVGAVRYRLYGISRRAERTGAARTGALARDAAELDRLALLGELGATVAHEVRNPLTGIRSLAQRLTGDEPADAARRARFAALIVSEVDRLDRFVGTMLALARRDPSPRSGQARVSVDVAALAEDLEALVAARAAERDVRLVARIGAPTAAAPRGALAQVLLNLLLNAIEHSPEGGEVTLDVQRAGGGGSGVAFAVRDRGPGIAPEARERLFEPFAPGARGTGLGLAVVRRVADAHGWRVRVEDGAGGGAAFVVEV